MGKATGFLEYKRQENTTVPPAERLKTFREFHVPLTEAERRCQSARCMDCGAPFCQSGMVL
ncbi:MAG: glutamate synthase, partial [Lachnospiraceae bacterium]|nr:glutamate synthase [Lachnospiraceae bacterium]